MKVVSVVDTTTSVGTAIATAVDSKTMVDAKNSSPAHLLMNRRHALAEIEKACKR